MVIVTFNRPKEVSDAVNSVLNQSVLPYELIIIDDASNPPIQIQTDIQNFTLIRFDEEQGISASRNYGIKISKGDYVAFIDDDCIASKYWLEEIMKGITAGGEIVGGPLKPRFSAKPPEWWTEKDFGAFVGVGNAESREIWGGNMVFKKDVLLQFGLFNINLGRKSGKLLSDEETAFIDRARSSSKLLFLPKAEVLHLVKSERMTFRYILKWSYYWGKTKRIKTGSSALSAVPQLLIGMIKVLNPLYASKLEKIKAIGAMVAEFGAIF